MNFLLDDLKLLGLEVIDGCVSKKKVLEILASWDSLAFSKRELENLFESFSLYLANTEGDFYKVSDSFEKEVKEEEKLDIKVHKLISEIFRSLDAPNGMQPTYDVLKLFLERVPKSILDRQLTDDIVKKHIPEPDWDNYRDKNWIRKAS